MPENPSAWLMVTAKHRALDIVRNETTARTIAPELGRLLHTEWADRTGTANGESGSLVRFAGGYYLQ